MDINNSDQIMDGGEQLFEWMQHLFPISRSITGPGIRRSLDFLTSLLPQSNWRYLDYPTGSQVGGWVVPEDWELISGTIKTIHGEILIDTKNSNLHVWSHSSPINSHIKWRDLKEFIATEQGSPEAIPYRTTYYKEGWGFSVSANRLNEIETMVEETELLEVCIDTKKTAGFARVLEIYIPGKSKSEIFLSSYLCHPSMANNELSGPLLATALARYLSKRDNYYSYRFVIGPETLGPICYLSNNREKLNNVWSAWNLTCVGDPNGWSLMPSPTGNTLSDRIARNLLKHHVNEYREYSYLSRGSDERQYCSPQVNLPMVSIMRSKYHEYPEYHTSLDNLDFVNVISLQETLDLYGKLIVVLDNFGKLNSTSVGEPFLSNYFPYPTIGGSFNKVRSGNDAALAQDICAFSSGLTMIEIAELMNTSIYNLIPTIKKLVDFRLIEWNPM